MLKIIFNKLKLNFESHYYGNKKTPHTYTFSISYDDQNFELIDGGDSKYESRYLINFDGDTFEIEISDEDEEDFED